MVSFSKNIKPGKVLWCQVVATNKEGIWVDIGDKVEGFVPNQEMKSLSSPPQIGENILTYVIQPPKSGSPTILSIDKARPFLTWYELKRFQENGESLEAIVIGFNKGGLLVKYQEVRGFVPLSQLIENKNSQYKNLSGQTIKLKVLEADQKQGKLILSQKAVVEQEKQEYLARLNKGEIYQGRVTGVHDFGAFVDIGGVEGLVPAFELSWTPVPPSEVVRIGQEIKVMVLKVDAENKKLVLSFKRAYPHPWELAASKYQIGNEVKGIVTKLLPFGVIARIDGTIDALAPISELSSRRINHPKEVVKTGQELTFKVIKIDQERRRFILSLKQVGGGES